jgi:hypothetical protein
MDSSLFEYIIGRVQILKLQSKRPFQQYGFYFLEPYAPHIDTNKVLGYRVHIPYC